MAAQIAWLLNLDADRELAEPTRYAPDAAMRARIAELVPRMDLLLRPQDLVLDDQAPGDARIVLPFCPTPWALARLGQLGLRSQLDVPLEVLRRVNGRAFCAALGQTLPGAAYVHDLASLERIVHAPDAAPVFVVKRAFGFAGRERRQVRGGVLDASTLGFVARSFRQDEGLQLEPWCERRGDFARHGWVRDSGELLLGPLVRQDNDATGRWLASKVVSIAELDVREAEALERELTRAGQALFDAGYRGPYGIDAFRYVDRAGNAAFQPRSEINARFTMGYPRELLDRALRSE